MGTRKDGNRLAMAGQDMKYWETSMEENRQGDREPPLMRQRREERTLHGGTGHGGKDPLHGGEWTGVQRTPL